MTGEPPPRYNALQLHGVSGAGACHHTAGSRSSKTGIVIGDKTYTSQQRSVTISEDI